MEKKLLILTILISLQAFCQEPNPEVFRQWFLHELTINEDVYIPSDYGHYPDIFIESSNDEDYISFANPSHVSCTSQIDFSETSPQDTCIIQGIEVCLL